MWDILPILDFSAKRETFATNIMIKCFQYHLMSTSKPLVKKDFTFRVPRVLIEKGRYHFILERCKGKKVLHLGCVDEGLTETRAQQGTLLHLQIEQVAREVWGIDSSQTGITLLRKYAKGKCIVGNAEYLEVIPELQKQNFDVIVATEMIEHLDNVGLFLESVKTLLDPQTVMILTTPNAFALNAVPYNVRGLENVHPDHNYWFSWRTLHTLLEKHGYLVQEEAVYSFGVFSWSTFAREFVSLVGMIVGKRIKTSVEDEGLKSFSHRVLDMLGFPIRWMLYRLNPFFAEGLMFVVRRVEKK